jgi:branched-chain amino acid aminotransferase
MLGGVSILSKEYLVYVDGEYVPRSEAKISVYDHGFLYGDGVFEGIRAYSGTVFRLREHIERLWHSARMLKMELPWSMEEMERVILETLRRNSLEEAYIRVLVTRGIGDLGIDPRTCEKRSLIVIAQPLKALLGEEFKKEGVRTIMTWVRRDSVDATTHETKSLNYLNSILAKIEAIQAGVPEAILLDRNGFVSEGSAENIFIVRDGHIYTPPSTTGILPGVTRSAVMEIADALGYSVEERNVTPFELISADEVFFTGTAAEIVPVREINGRPIGEGGRGPITAQLMEEFDRFTRDPGNGIRIAQDIEMRALEAAEK